MKSRIFAACTAALILAATPALADWKPSGPINLMIAFAAGGGADTQARLIAAELEARKGWKIVPQNVTGKGGTIMASKLKSQPNDGLAIGIAVTETFAYNMLAARKRLFSEDEFTFITTTAGSQMGIVARTDRGWKTIHDLVKAAKAGMPVRFGSMAARLSDIAYVLSNHLGVEFNIVPLKGGRASLNAVVAGDVDVGWGAGIQNRGVRAGDLVNLLSGEPTKLAVSPDAPTLRSLGLEFDAGGKFVIVGPKGIPDAARKAYAAAIGEILNDKSTKAAQFVQRAFGGPTLISGADLEKLIQQEIADSKRLLKAAS